MELMGCARVRHPPNTSRGGDGAMMFRRRCRRSIRCACVCCVGGMREEKAEKFLEHNMRLPARDILLCCIVCTSIYIHVYVCTWKNDAFAHIIVHEPSAEN